MGRFTITKIGCLLVFVISAAANATCTVPNVLTNGQVADATQVMGNFNALVTCTTDASNLTSGDLAAGRMTTNLSGALDSAFGSTQGSILYRGSSGWAALGPGIGGYVLSTNGGGANPSWVPQAGSGDFTLVASVNLGTVNHFAITGLDTLNFDYRLAIRLGPRASGGVATDYIKMQFGDTTLPTPTWFTTGGYINASGAAAGALTSSGGVTNIAQVNRTGNRGGRLV